MGAAPTHCHNSQGTAPKSHFQQTVCLADWWLVKAENDFQGSRLAVAGFSYREKQAMRVFSSAPILKIYDAFTLENSDGICVILKGFINKDRTMENGFPSDICNHFAFGFPPYWKEYDEKFLCKASPSDDSPGADLLKKASPQSETEGEQNEDGKNITKVNKKKRNSKATRPRPRSAPAAADNQKLQARADEDHLPNKTSGTKVRKKLAYETPVRERENKKVASNEVRSTRSRSRSCTANEVPLTRSRSGRLLMPTLEFWRNQRAVYDVDRTVTEIRGNVHPEQQESSRLDKFHRKFKRK